MSGPKCVCPEGSWLIATVPPACTKFKPDGTDENLCDACEHEVGCHVPAITAPVAALERELREALEWAWAQQYEDGGIHGRQDAYIAQALARLGGERG